MVNLIQAFLGLAVAVIMFQILSSVSTPMYTLGTVTNETFTFNDSDSYQLAHYPIVNGTYTLYNETAQTTELTDETHYKFDTLSNGTIVGIAGIAPEHTVSIDYSYYPSEYISDSQARTMFSFIILMLAVAIVVFLAVLIKV